MKMLFNFVILNILREKILINELSKRKINTFFGNKLIKK